MTQNFTKDELSTTLKAIKKYATNIADELIVAFENEEVSVNTHRCIYTWHRVFSLLDHYNADVIRECIAPFFHYLKAKDSVQDIRSKRWLIKNAVFDMITASGSSFNFRNISTAKWYDTMLQILKQRIADYPISFERVVTKLDSVVGAGSLIDLKSRLFALTRSKSDYSLTKKILARFIDYPVHRSLSESNRSLIEAMLSWCKTGICEYSKLLTEYKNDRAGSLNKRLLADVIDTLTIMSIIDPDNSGPWNFMAKSLSEIGWKCEIILDSSANVYGFTYLVPEQDEAGAVDRFFDHLLAVCFSRNDVSNNISDKKEE